ncbi:ankyrin repeat-containing domain protein [Aspergillus karnatakaensis]|uniref:ankyrin repeat domain-containing protein n=1 Tax=Aspergillus karnatakaensis TaxID=1810916 RepID=UPI003CCD055B
MTTLKQKSALPERPHIHPDQSTMHASNTFGDVWHAICSMSEPSQTLAKRALRWVQASRKPLTTPEILAAIRLPANGKLLPVAESVDKEGLLNLCNGLLKIDPEDKVWQFADQNSREHLETKEGWSAGHAHYLAATVCLGYFIRNYKDENTGLDARIETQWAAQKAKDNGPGEDEDEDESPEIPYQSDTTLHTLHPFHIYMRHSWAYHVKLAGNVEDDELSSLLKTFLESPNVASRQYQRWHDKTESDFDEFFFGPSLRAYMTDEARNTFLETKPAEVPVFAMCAFSLDTPLWDWWKHAEIDISQINERGHNLLAIAAHAGSVAICKSLVRRGIDVNGRPKGSEYGSALVAAAAGGHTDVIEFLVETGADVNLSLKTDEGKYDCALEAAVKRSDIETVGNLVQDAKADINIPLARSATGHIVGEAALLPCVDILKILIGAGADVNATFTDRDYGSPLAAACSCNLENVKFLIQAGADVNLQLPGGYGCALLQACISDSSLEIARYLVNEADADPNLEIKGGDHGSVLAGAVCVDVAELDTAKFLVESGAEINRPLRHGKYGSALAAAAAASEFADLEILPWLLSQGADPNLPLEYGQFGSALAAAVWSGIHSRIQTLIESGADPDMQLENRDFSGAFALAAAFGQDFQVPEALVQAKANVNLKTAGRYGTPLIAAACFGQRKCVEYLVEQGADVNLEVEDTPFLTALQAAQSSISEHLPWIRWRYPNEEDVECFSEEWAEEKPAIVEFLLGHGASKRAKI